MSPSAGTPHFNQKAPEKGAFCVHLIGGRSGVLGHQIDLAGYQAMSFPMNTVR